MFAIYKKSAALQIDLIPATRIDDKFKRVERFGAIYLEMSKAVPGKDKTYNWDEKVNFAISYGDLPIIYTGIGKLRGGGEMDITLFHDPQAGTSDKGKNVKIFSIKAGSKAGTFFLKIQKAKDNYISIPLNTGELMLFIRFIEDNQNVILGEVGYKLIDASP